MYFKHLLLLIFLSSVSFAQQNWVHQTGKSGVTFEIVKSFFDNDCPNAIECKDYSALSADYYVGGVYFVSPRLAIIGEIPFTYHSATRYEEGHSYLAEDVVEKEKRDRENYVFGNPLVGASYSIPQMPISVVLALRIPIVAGGLSEDELFALNAGRYGDFERKDAFVKDAMPLMTAITWKYKPDWTRHSLRIQAGGKLVFDTGGGTTKNAEVLCAFADLDFDPVVLRAGYMLYTIDMIDRLQEIAGFSGAIHLGRFTPGVGVRFLVGDMLPYYAHASINMNLTYRFTD